ncbi:serine hydrolase domain-containing protein [Terriglobus aquaticus]|uniref:Serine hydrolase domain-containing protein n=1 Tax=Terriglobus aquaticus TaxID=940139 RepID=A0ABW9KFU1_9BACT|nr:serine hydrolase domain-containing protein [Terriglobus aquaticus]
MNRRNFVATAGAAATALLPRGAFARSLSPLQPLITASGFCGTALVARGSAILLHQGFGPAERNFQTPCRPDTRYRIASITKLFTATLIVQLAGEGKLDLDRTIGTYLPQYPGPARDRSTLRQLLHHTSGIENFDKGLTSFAGAQRSGMPAYQMPHSTDDLLNLFASGALAHQPGSVFDYNNADFIILGKIIEAVELSSFDQILQRRICQPLGLTATGLFPSRHIQPALASTYYRDTGQPLGNDLPVYAENWYAAGGMTSTTADVLKFAQALFHGNLIPGPALAELLTPGLEDYGFGLWIGTLEANGRKYHFAQRPGRIMGANTLLLQLLDEPLTVILLGNTNLTDTDRLGFDIAKQVLTS